MSRRGTLRTILCLAVLLPAAAVWLGEWIFWTATRRPEVAFNDGTRLWLDTALVGAPFLLLGLYVAGAPKSRQEPLAAAPGAGRAALFGTAVTCLVWGYFYYDGYAYWRDRRTTGVDFGLAFLMLGSPLLVCAAMIAGVASARRARRAAGAR